MNDKKILIAYFSWSGNTKSIAEKIHNTVGGDMFQIETETPYPLFRVLIRTKQNAGLPIIKHKKYRLIKSGIFLCSYKLHCS